MKKLSLCLTLVSVSTAMANTNCLKSIEAAIEINQKFIDSRAQVSQEYYQMQQRQQQSSSSIDDETSWLQHARAFKLDVVTIFREVTRLPRAKKNMTYLTALKNIEEGHYSGKDIRAVIGPKHHSNFLQYIQSGNSVCISEQSTHDIIRNFEDMDQRSLEHMLKYGYGKYYGIQQDKIGEYIEATLNLAESKLDALERFEYAMPGFTDDPDYGQRYSDINNSLNFSINPIRVMTKTELRNAFK